MEWRIIIASMVILGLLSFWIYTTIQTFITQKWLEFHFWGILTIYLIFGIPLIVALLLDSLQRSKIEKHIGILAKKILKENEKVN